MGTAASVGFKNPTTPAEAMPKQNQKEAEKQTSSHLGKETDFLCLLFSAGFFNESFILVASQKYEPFSLIQFLFSAQPK